MPADPSALRTPLRVVLVVALLAAFLLQGLAFLRANSQTFDEAVHLTAGYSYLATGDFRLNPGHPPLSKLLAALPLYVLDRPSFEPTPALWEAAKDFVVGRDFLYGGATSPERALFLGRLPNLLLGLALVALVGWWAARLWGPGAGLLALTLAAFDPTLVAHASVITPDLALASFYFAACYLAWEYARAPSPGRRLAVGVATGCALASKYTALALPAALGLALLLDESSGPGAWRSLRRFRSAALTLLAILLVAVVTVSIFYFGYGLPAWYTGFTRLFGRPETPAFLLGEIRTGGWWLYFPIAFALKTPDGTLLLLVLSGLLFGFGARFRRRSLLFLALPAGLYFAAMVVSRVNVGIRYLLPVYPFVWVACSCLATLRPVGAGQRMAHAASIALALGLSIGASLRVAPHQLAFFNVLAGGPANGPALLGDSNLDWGQDLKNLREFLAREGVPGVYLSYFGTAPPRSWGLRYQHLPGFFEPLQDPSAELLPADIRREWLAVSVSNLQGIFLPDRELYAWLRSRKPIARIGHSIHVYDVTGDADAHRRLARIYRRVGLRHHAEREARRAAGRGATRPLPEGSE